MIKLLSMPNSMTWARWRNSRKNGIVLIFGMLIECKLGHIPRDTRQNHGIEAWIEKKRF